MTDTNAEGVEPQHVDPAVVLRPGRFDPAALLVAWFVRRSFVPLLLVGLTIVTVAGRLDDPTLDLTSPSAVVRALLTPWVGVVVAFGLRIGANLAALLLAFPLTRWLRPDDYRVGSSSGRVRAWADRWNRTAAYRALRWTWPVRCLAAERLGRSARWLLVIDRIWVGFGVLAVLVLLVAGMVVAVNPTTGPT